jgi:phosphatidylglycerophosphatase A
MAVRTPSERLLLFVGSLAYLGFVPVASGSVAVAVAGIPLYLLMTVGLRLNTMNYGLCVVALTLVAIYVSGRADRILQEKDSKKNVIDELPGYLIALVGLPVDWRLIGAAYFIERVIDITKVWPANLIERRLPGGWGVVLDDVVAGIYSLAILHALVAFAPAGWGLGA